MKSETGNRNNGFNRTASIRMVVLSWLMLTFISLAFGQVERSKSINKTFKGSDRVQVEHRHGPLVVKRSSDGQVRIEASISVKARSEEDASAVLERFDVSATESGSELKVSSNFNTKNWSSNNGRIRLDFNDGTRIKDLRDLRVSFILYVPKLQELKLSNKYDEIIIQDDFTGNISVNLYSGKIETQRIDGNLTLSMKYSKGQIGNAGDGTFDLYDCSLAFGNLRNVNIESKYSKLQMGNAAMLTADTYDGELTIGKVAGSLTITDKYSDFNIKSFSMGRMDLYDSNIIADEGQDLQVKSKYTKFSIGKLGDVGFEISYDDDVSIGELGGLVANSKYTKFSIGVLQRGLTLKSYDDQVSVGEVSGPLNAINFEGKYTDLTLKIPAGQHFQLDANLTYGRLIYPEDRFESQFFKEQNDKLEVRGRTKGAGDDSPRIIIKSYDGKIVLE